MSGVRRARVGQLTTTRCIWGRAISGNVSEARPPSGVERVAAFELASGQLRWTTGVRTIPAQFEPVRGRMLVTPIALGVRTGQSEGIVLHRTTGAKLGDLKAVGD